MTVESACISNYCRESFIMFRRWSSSSSVGNGCGRSRRPDSLSRMWLASAASHRMPHHLSHKHIVKNGPRRLNVIHHVVNWGSTVFDLRWWNATDKSWPMSADKSWPTFLGRYFMSQGFFLPKFFVCVHPQNWWFIRWQNIDNDCFILIFEKEKQEKLNNVGAVAEIHCHRDNSSPHLYFLTCLCVYLHL